MTPKQKEEEKRDQITNKQSPQTPPIERAVKTQKPPASVGANWRETTLGKKSPRPGSYEYETRYDFGELQKLMGAYKRKKHTVNQAKDSLKDVEAKLGKQASKLGVDVKLNELSEYEPTESDSE